MTGNGERRQGIFYKRMFWAVLAGAAGIAATVTLQAYGSLERRIEAKADRSEVAAKADRSEMISLMKKLDSLQDDVREIRNWIIPSNPRGGPR